MPVTALSHCGLQTTIGRNYLKIYGIFVIFLSQRKEVAKSEEC